MLSQASTPQHTPVTRPLEPSKRGRLRVVSPTLPHTLVFLAFSDSGARAREALATLYETYREPCITFICGWRRAYTRDDAEEILQEFVVQRIEKQDLVRSWDPQRTRFRTWLLSSLRHFLLNRRRRDVRLEERSIALEDLAGFDPAHGETPEILFTREFARVVLARALAALRAEYARRPALFTSLVPYLDMTPPPYAELSLELGRTRLGLRQEMKKLRDAWKRLMRDEVAQIACEAQVDSELRAFLLAFEVRKPE